MPLKLIPGIHWLNKGFSVRLIWWWRVPASVCFSYCEILCQCCEIFSISPGSRPFLISRLPSPLLPPPVDLPSPLLPGSLPPPPPPQKHVHRLRGDFLIRLLLRRFPFHKRTSRHGGSQVYTNTAAISAQLSVGTISRRFTISADSYHEMS